MTLPVACPPATADPQTPLPQRKRRRRTPASGASDDCFACTKRGVKCDRRRPYCSPCLEVGNECSGYKTQLTWGVGVASRGKLRGLSLPVARSAPAAKSPPANRHKSAALAAAAAATKVHEEAEMKIKMEASMASIPSSPFTTYDFVNMAPHGVAPPTTMAPEWNMAVSHEYPIHPDYHQEGMSQQRQLPQLNRLHTMSLGRLDATGLGSPIDSLSTYDESDYCASPISQSYPDDASYMHSPVPMYGSYSSGTSGPASPAAGVMGDARGPTSCPEQHYYAQSDLSSSIGSHQNPYDMIENRQHQSSPNVREVFYDDDMLGKFTSGCLGHIH